MVTLSSTSWDFLMRQGFLLVELSLLDAAEFLRTAAWRLDLNFSDATQKRFAVKLIWTQDDDCKVR